MSAPMEGRKQKVSQRVHAEPSGAQWTHTTTNKILSTLSQLARLGQLGSGDMQMAELYTSRDESPGVEGTLKGVTVDGATFARDRSRIRHWDISVQGLGNDDVYVGSIMFPPDHPACPPVLLYAERKGALPLCPTIIRNGRIMNDWDERVWGDNDLVSEVDESLELDLVPKLNKESGAWCTVYWSQYITARECLENLRDFLHAGLRHRQGKEAEDSIKRMLDPDPPFRTADTGEAAAGDGTVVLDRKFASRESEGSDSQAVSPTGLQAEAAVEGTARKSRSVSPSVLLCNFEAAADASRKELDGSWERLQEGETKLGGTEGDGTVGTDDGADDRKRKKLNRRREEFVAGELHKLFLQRNVQWQWDTTTLPAPEAGELAIGPSSPGAALSQSGNMREVEDTSVLSVDVRDTGSDDGRSGTSAGACSHARMADALRGAWVLVVVVSEGWDESGSGGKGQYEKGGGYYQECRRLLHESNRYVLVLRLHADLPQEMLPGWNERSASPAAVPDDSDEDEEALVGTCADRFVMHMVVPDELLAEKPSLQRQGERVRGKAGGGIFGPNLSGDARNVPKEIYALMGLQCGHVLDWVDACIHGRPLAAGLFGPAPDASNRDRSRDRRAADELPDQQDEQDGQASRHLQLQLVMSNRLLVAAGRGGARWERGAGRGRRRGDGRRLKEAYGASAADRTQDSTRVPAIPLPCSTMPPLLAHRVFLSYSWRNSFAAVQGNQIPPELFEGNPWTDPRRIKLALESRMQHLFGHELECWLDVDRLKASHPQAGGSAGRHTSDGGMEASDGEESLEGGGSASREDDGDGALSSLPLQPLKPFVDEGLVNVIVRAIRSAEAVVVFMSDEYADSTRCRFECEAALSQLPTALGPAALCAPVVLALVGSVRSSTTPVSMMPMTKTPNSRGSPAKPPLSSGGVGAGHVVTQTRRFGSSSSWISSPLGKLVQGCVQVDFREVTGEEEMMNKASDLRRALLRAMATASQLKKLLPTPLSPLRAGKGALKAGGGLRGAGGSREVVHELVHVQAAVPGLETLLRLDKVRRLAAGRLLRVNNDNADIDGMSVALSKFERGLRV